MVAYSFAPQFADQVATLAKRQTVRADRKRHARAGERIQLYAGMRTRQCRKLVEIDPICTDVRPIEIDIASVWIESREAWGAQIAGITIDHSVVLKSAEIESFAIADGFGASALYDGLAAMRMADFWRVNHGLGLFTGVLIRWEPSR